MKKTYTRHLGRAGGLFTALLLMASGASAFAIPQGATAPPDQTHIYVNDNLTTGDVYTSAIGDPSGNGTRNHPYVDIATAMGFATSGATIYVDAGTFNLSSKITIKSGVRLIGLCSERSIISALSTGDAGNHDVVLSSGSELSRFKITRDGVGTQISVSTQSGATNVKINNCFFDKCRSAIYVGPVDGLVIEHNDFNDNRTGILFIEAGGHSNISVLNNNIVNNRTFGILFHSNTTTKSNILIANNNLSGNLASNLEVSGGGAAGTVSLNNNWFGVYPVNPSFGEGNGYFTVNDHDVPGITFVDNNGTSTPPNFPLGLSGLNQGAINYGSSAFATSVRPFTIAGCSIIGSSSTLNATPGTPGGFLTLQDAINQSNTGATVTVPAGTYSENLIVDRSLSILGPNASTSGCDARIAEAIILPATTQTSVQSTTSGTIFRLGKTGVHIDVTIKGLTIDGHNDALTGGRMLNGVSVHTGAGIVNSIGSFDTNPSGYDVTMTIQNNIIQNLERYGVLADGTAGRPAMAGTDVSHNKIDNIPSGNSFGGERGRGIAFEENHYGSATYNCISRVNVGWQDDNYNLASTGAGTVVSNNTISSYHRGIFHNLQYQNATNATITDNIVSAESANNSGTDFGIELASIQGTVGATVTGNNVTGKTYGILLWNNPTSANISVAGGTLTGNVTGILATGTDPQFGAGAASTYSLDGITVAGGTTGLMIQGNATVASLGTTAFSGQAGNHLQLVNSAGSVDATAASFNSLTGAGTLADNYTIEDKILHKLDNASLGFVTVKANNTFVTTNSGSIQRGVDAASNGFTVNVAPGTFNENVAVNKAVTLEGAGAATEVTKASTCTSNGNGITVTAAATVKGLKITNYVQGVRVDAAGVTLDRIESSSNCSYGIEILNGSNNLAIKNTIIRNNGAVGIRAGTTAQLTGVIIDSCNVTGNPQGMAIYAVPNATTTNLFDNVTITNSDFSNNTQKGIYVEKLSNALIEHNVMANSGTDITYNSNTGLDINLKNGAYTNIAIQNNSFSGCGVLKPGRFAESAMVMSISARNDVAPYITYPATLANVSVINNVISGPQNGVRFGEPGITIANLQVNDNDFSAAFANKAIINASTGNANANCNWFGTTDAAYVAGMIAGNVTYAPYRTDGMDGDAAVGFQPSNACVGSCTITASTTTTNTTCPATNGTATVTIGGSSVSPYTYTLGAMSNATGEFSNLSPGTYPVTVTDNTGCTATSSAVITTVGSVHNVTKAIDYCTIQEAVSAASANDMITVDAGTYDENVTVATNGLTIKGANYGVAGAAARGAESIIRTKGNQTALVTVTANNVTIDGFTLDGDDTTLSGAPTKSGADVNAGILVSQVTTGNHLNVSHNILKNSLIGVYGKSLPVTTPSVGNVISENWFDAIGNFDYGYAVSIRDNYYAQITGNKMTKVWTGVHINNHNLPSGSGAYDLTSNNISSYATGVCYWLNRATSSAYNISNNEISAESGAVANNAGVSIVTLRDGVAPTFTGNTIAGTDYGFALATVTTPLTIGANTITGTKIAGIMLTDNLANPVGTTPLTATGEASAVSIGAVAITAAAGGTGILIDGSNTAHSIQTMSFTGAATINDGASGLVLNGYTAVTGGSINNLSFSGQTGDYVKLVNSTTNLNATTTSFDGKTGAGTLADNYAIEDKITHKVDNTTLGFVTVLANNDFVTPTGSVQRGISAASTGFTVNVAAGTYNESLNINKTLMLSGAQANNCAATRTGAESIINSVNGNGINASNVTVNGFTIQGQTTAAAPGFGYGVYMVPTNTGTQLLNNIIKDNVVGSSVSNAGANPAEVLISCNLFKDNNNAGPSQGAGIYTDEYVAGGVVSNVRIDNNKFTGHVNDGGIDFSITQPIKAATGITITNNDFDGNRRAVFLDNVVSSTFNHNEIHNSTGAGTGDVRIYGGVNNLSIANNNFVGGVPEGIRITNDAGFDNDGISINDNSFTGYSSATNAINVVSGYPGSLAANCNWFGTITTANIAAQIGNAASAAITYSPWRSTGADGDAGALGFVPDGPCDYNSNAPMITSCPAGQEFCQDVMTGSYTIPSITASPNCGAIAYAYSITGTTTRSGTTSDASGLFNPGTSVVAWTVTDGCGNTSTCNTQVIIVPTPEVNQPSNLTVCNTDVTSTIAFTSPASVLSSSNLYSVNQSNNRLYTVSGTTHQQITNVTATLPGYTVNGMNYISKDPISGQYYVIVKTSGGSNARRLGVIDPTTGIITDKGSLGDAFSSITFSNTGVLYGVTGDGANTSETLYELDKNTAATTLLTPLGNGGDGEVIQFNPADGQIYHWSGNGTVHFEKINPTSLTVTPIGIYSTGVGSGEVFGASVDATTGNFITCDIGSSAETWSTTGPVSYDGQWGAGGRGFASGSSATVYTWSNDNTAIGLAASGTGGIPSFSATNGTNAPITANITVTPIADRPSACVGNPKTFTVTVNPTPDVTVSTPLQSICNSSSIATITSTGTVSGTVFEWTRSNTTDVTGMNSSGTGNISGSLFNTTNAPVSVTFTVTPTYTNAGTTCTGTPQIATVVVNPTPTVTSVMDQTTCNSSNTATVAFTGAVTGTTYKWTNSDPTIGLAASGTGDIVSFTATNSGSTAKVATVVVTPEYAGCFGSTTSFTYTVNPTPNLTIAPMQATQTICNASNIIPIVPESNVIGTTFNWTRSVNPDVTGLTGPGTGSVSGSLTNLTNTAKSVMFTFTSSAAGCVGATNTATVTVQPTLGATAVTVSPSYTVSGQELQTIYLNYPSAGTASGTQTLTAGGTGGSGAYTYKWVKTGCAIPATEVSTSNPYTFTATNADAVNIGSSTPDNIYTFTVTVTDGIGCTAVAKKNINVVNPMLANGTYNVCHKTAVRGSTVSSVQNVPANQLSLHVAHGDIMGNCTPFDTARDCGAAHKEAPVEPISTFAKEQEVHVYPNPNTGMFVLDMSEIKEQANIMIMDIAGKIVAMKTLAKEEAPTATFDLTQYAKGMYLITVKDGDFNYRAKVVVQ